MSVYNSVALLNVNNLINQKDSRWLQLEVCREFQRNKCTRSDTECKFAHPPPNVEVQNGKVTACYDSIKGRCNRDKPPCKYFHPPQHLKDQLLVNGRNHLALKNALIQQMGYAAASTTSVPGTQPAMIPGTVAAQYGTAHGVLQPNPYVMSHPHLAASVGPYPGLTAAAAAANTGSPLMTLLQADGSAVAGQGGHHNAAATTAVAALANKTHARSDMVGSAMPYKRLASDKSGVPVYQPSQQVAAYQQALLQLQQPFIPVTYGGVHPAAAMSMPRYQ